MKKTKNIFLLNNRKKIIILSITILFLPVFAHAQLRSWIKTGGFDYEDYNDAQASWLGQHHDVIIGYPGLTNSTRYNIITGTNHNVVFLPYIPYDSNMGTDKTALESWAQANGHDIEELYYHYYFDTTVRCSSAGGICLPNTDSACTGLAHSCMVIPGYGGGSATSLDQSRVRAIWNQGANPHICPLCSTWRDAYNARIVSLMTAPTVHQNVTGIFLDSATGEMDNYWDLQLERTIEMRAIGITTEAAAVAKSEEVVGDHWSQLKTYLNTNIGATNTIMPNAAELSYALDNPWPVFQSSPITPGVEYLTTSVYVSRSRIPYLKSVYDSMEGGKSYFFNSQTNVGSGSYPETFIQHIIGVFYLINHSNATFSLHIGSAAFYGTNSDHDYGTSHWHKNLEFDVGSPVVRADNDYWGVPNTDRFYQFASGADDLGQYEILARNYSNVKILVKFSNVGGIANINSSNGKSTHDLGGTYRRLQPDNTLGDPITSITLGVGDGAILIPESADIIAPASPTGLSVQ